MTKNVGSIDKSLRLLLGVSLIGYGLYFNNWLGFIGIIPLLTGLINWCPLYSLIGIKTCSVN